RRVRRALTPLAGFRALEAAVFLHIGHLRLQVHSPAQETATAAVGWRRRETEDFIFQPGQFTRDFVIAFCVQAASFTPGSSTESLSSAFTIFSTSPSVGLITT